MRFGLRGARLLEQCQASKARSLPQGGIGGVKVKTRWVVQKLQGFLFDLQTTRQFWDPMDS